MTIIHKVIKIRCRVGCEEVIGLVAVVSAAKTREGGGTGQSSKVAREQTGLDLNLLPTFSAGGVGLKSVNAGA